MKKIIFAIILVFGIVITYQFTTPDTDLIEPEPTTAADGVVLLELFTSQGCSSCPPADALLDKTLNKNKNVIGLSYHVDYWNYIGWTDPFSSKTYSNYQRTYASKLNSSSVYTPQLVVDGKTHFTGSNASQLSSKLKSDDYYMPKQITIDGINKSKAKIDFSLASEMESDYLTVVLVIKERETPIPRGENRNRTLKNTNIVVSREVLTNSKGKQMSLNIPDIVNSSDELKLIAYAQNSDLRVLSAVEKDI